MLAGELLTAPDLVLRLADVSGAAIPFNSMFDVELLEMRAVAGGAHGQRVGRRSGAIGCRGRPRI